MKTQFSVSLSPERIDHFIDNAQIVFCFAQIVVAAGRRLLWA